MEDRSNEVLVCAIFFLVLSTICVGLRIYTRAYMLKCFGLDDWSMVATQAFFAIYIGCQLGGVRYGTGRHNEDLDPEDAKAAMRFWFFCEIFYVLTSVMLKVAIGIFLRRIAVNPIHIWIIWGIIGSTTLFGTMYFLVLIFQCQPISVFWNINPGGPGCLDTEIVVGCTYAAGVLNALADWTFGLLPFFIVWDLKMTKKAKGLVAGILAFAAIGSTATVIRIPYVHGLGETHDFLWTTMGVAIWSTVEPGIGISAGCIATLRPLFRNVLWKFGMGTLPRSSSGFPSHGMDAKARRTPSRDLDSIQLQGAFHTKITSTITGNDRSDDYNSKAGRNWNSRRRLSDEENLRNGISKHVEVEYEESRAASRTPTSFYKDGIVSTEDHGVGEFQSDYSPSQTSNDTMSRLR